MKKLPSLNGLRAISILIVIVCHLAGKGYISRPEVPLNLLDPFFHGGFGVNVFFVISGFLITGLLLAEEEKTGWINLRDFYIRRTLRIFPAFYFLLLVYFLLQLCGYIKIPNMAWLTAITYTKYLFKSGKEWYTGHTWSLCVEEHFYLFWPFLFRLNKKIRRLAPWLLILVTLSYKLAFTFLYPNSISYNLNILSRIDGIAIGCLFAIHKDRIIGFVKSRWNLLLTVSVVVLLSLNLYDNHPVHQPFIKRVMLIAGGLDGTISNFAIAGIMMYSVFGPHNWWYALLNSRVMNYIGLLSYSLYLWQALFINNTVLVINRFPLNLLLIAGAALFSYYVVEKPFLRLKAMYQRVKT